MLRAHAPRESDASIAPRSRARRRASYGTGWPPPRSPAGTRPRSEGSRRQRWSERESLPGCGVFSVFCCFLWHQAYSTREIGLSPATIGLRSASAIRTDRNSKATEMQRSATGASVGRRARVRGHQEQSKQGCFVRTTGKCHGSDNRRRTASRTRHAHQQAGAPRSGRISK